MRRSTLLVVFALLAACDGGGTTPPGDAGADAAPGADVSPPDGGADAALDGGGDPVDFVATVTIDGTAPGPLIEGSLFGSNLLAIAPAAQTVDDAAFIESAQEMSLSYLRWPGGNLSDTHDWKNDVQLRPGRRVARPDGVSLEALLRFTTTVGAEPVITINFGTMTPDDAADLVEFLNGPADSEWGAERAALGHVEPIGVRYFEVGNEENQPHMWFYSWTAEDSMKYFFGGDEERRGAYDNSGGPAEDPFGMKGDAFRIRPSDEPGQLYPLRFVPFRDVNVSWADTEEDAMAGRLVEWTEVSDLSTQAADAQVFVVDEALGGVRFGDGEHGALPAVGDFFNIEYTTYGHAGFVDFSRAMRAAPSSVPIEIGAAILPADSGGVPITDADGMAAILDATDFFVRHQYNAGMPSSEWGEYRNLRQVALDRVGELQEVADGVHAYARSIGITRSFGLGLTEWNIFLAEIYWELNRSQAGAVIGGEVLIRALAAQPTLPVSVANHFALHGGALALLRSQTSGSMAPMGHVFAGFSRWVGSRHLPTVVDSPTERAFSEEVPFVTGTAALSADGSTVRVAAVNNAEHLWAQVHLEVDGFAAGRSRLNVLAGEHCSSHNDSAPDDVMLEDLGEVAFSGDLSVPPCSIVFVELQRD